MSVCRVVESKEHMSKARYVCHSIRLACDAQGLVYALGEAMQQTVPLPTVAVVREIYQLAIARGLGDLDFAAVSEALRDEPEGKDVARPRVA